MFKKFSVNYWSNKFYPEPILRDPVICFIRKIEDTVKDNFVVLDLGAGAGELNKYNLKGHGRQIYGIDLDPRVVENKNIDHGIVGNVNTLPFLDNSFDLIFSIYVLEHIECPELFTREISRVLKPGGIFMAITPNKYHYVPLIAKITPTWFHKKLNESRGRSREDTFKTFYKLNSERDLRKHFSTIFHFTNFKTEFIEVRPNYLMFSLVTFLIGSIYEKIVNSANIFRYFRVNILVSVSKEI